MKTPDTHLNIVPAKLPGQIHRSGELIGLHPDQYHQPPAIRRLNRTDNPLHVNMGVRFVVGIDLDLDIVADPAPVDQAQGYVLIVDDYPRSYFLIARCIERGVGNKNLCQWHRAACLEKPIAATDQRWLRLKTL